LFFDRFREALSRLPDGLVRTGPPASAAALVAAETALGRSLPPALRSFLESFDGVDLFHEAVLVAGVGPQAPLALAALNRGDGRGALVFGEAAGGDRFALREDGKVLRLRGGGEGGGEGEYDKTAADEPSRDEPERWLAGSDFSKWLEALVAHERVLYGPDGEFSPDAFEPDGAEILPLVALRQTERALRIDPDAADFHHERAIALRRLGRDDDARAAFERAARLDAENPWTWFDLGRAALAAGVAGAREALAAFENAGRLDRGQTGARFWVWAARAAQLLGAPERMVACRQEALARVPALATALRRACEAAAGSDDSDELVEAEALRAALEDPVPAGRARLTVLPDSDSPRHPHRSEPPTKKAALQTRGGNAPAGRASVQRRPGERGAKPRR
jgi:tetratricopeptide (TPR) repeat protein